MTKKKSKSHTTHKTHEAHNASEEKEGHVSSKVVASPIMENIALIAVVFLVVGLIVGALISYGAFMMGGPAEVVNTNGNGANLAAGSVDTQALKLKVESYVNTNMLPPEVNFAVNDVNGGEDGIFALSYTITQDGEVVEDGVIYSTKDKIIRGSVLDLEETIDLTPEPTDPLPSTEVSKQEVPDAELYIWSYCPYGVTALAPFADVAVTVGDKANFDVVLYYDGHGAYETQQNKIQACIQEIDKDKYWDYALSFVENIYPKCGPTGDVACNLDESTKLMDSLGIDSTAVLDCVETQGEALLAASSAKAQSLGVTGSPTLVVNGTKVTNVARTADGFLGAVCSGFITPLEGCSAELSSNAGTVTGSC